VNRVSERVMMLVFFAAIGLLPIIGIIDNTLNPRDKRQDQKSGPVGRFGDCGEDGALSSPPLELQTAQPETAENQESAGQAM
jgi:hypothetical protein